MQHARPSDLGALGLALVALGLATPAQAQSPTEPPPTPPAEAQPDAPDEAPGETPGEQPPAARSGPETLTVLGVQLDRRAASTYPLSGISREEFVHQPKSQRLGDLIDRMPGVFGAGDLGANTDTALRGLNHHWTRFEFDGVMLPSHGPGRDYRMNSLSPIAVQELVVLRNPPPEFESDGIGGHIMATRRPIPTEPYFEFILGGGVLLGGSVDTGYTGDVSVAGGDRFGDFGLAVYADYNRHPLFRRTDLHITRNDDGSLVEDRDAATNRYIHNFTVAPDIAYFYGSGEIHLKPLFLLYMTTSDSTSTEERIRPGREPERTVGEDAQPEYRVGGTISHIHHISSAAAIETDVGYYRYDSGRDNRDLVYLDAGAGYVLDETETSTRDVVHHFPQVRVKYTQYHELLGLPQTFKAGVMGRWRRFETDDEVRAFDADGALTDASTPEGEFELHEDYYAVFAQDEIELFDDFTILFGARLEYTDNFTDVTRDNPNSEAANPDRARDSTTLDINPHLSLNYQLAEMLSFRATGSRTINRPGFREQSTLELDREVIERGNPDLIPTRAWNFDVGVDFRPNRHIFLAVTGYHKRLTDVAEQADTGETRDDKPIYQYENIGDGIVQGVEIEQSIDLGIFTNALAGLEVWANQTILETEVTLADGTTTPFSAHANFLANVGFDWTVPASGTLLSFAAKYQGEYTRYRTENDNEVTDPTWFLNAAVGQQLTDGLLAKLEVQNLITEQQRSVRVREETTELRINEFGRYVRLSVHGVF